MNKQQPRTLYRADPRDSFLQNDIVIRISVTHAILIAFILFLIACSLIVPATNGFFWW